MPKDELFYYDFNYQIRKLSGLPIITEEETEKRIMKREKEILGKDNNGKPFYMLSDFTLELFEFTNNVSQAAGVFVNGPYHLREHPEIVTQILEDYNKQISESRTN